jgi:hypothetical protein
MGTCVPMGLLPACQEMQWFAEIVLQSFTSTNILEYQDAQDVLKRAFGTPACYNDDTCAVSFGTRKEHEILPLQVLKRMDAHNLCMQPARCEFLHQWRCILGSCASEGSSQKTLEISAIKNWPPLTDIRSVRVFVSSCSYYHKYIWCFAEISAPLTDLLKDWTVALTLCPRRARGCRVSAVCARQQPFPDLL